MEHRSKELFDSPPPQNTGTHRPFRPGFWGMVLLVLLVGLAASGVIAVVGPLVPKKFTARAPGMATVERVAEAMRTLPLRGTVELVDQGVLTAPEAGTVSRIEARAGEVVPPGRVLAVVDARELGDQLKTVRDNLLADEDGVRALTLELDLLAQKSAQDQGSRARDLGRKATLVAEQADLVTRGLASARTLRDLVWDQEKARDADAQAKIDERLAQLRVEADLTRAVRERDQARALSQSLEARIAGCVVRSPDEILVLGTDQLRTGAVVARDQTLVAYARLTRAEVRFDVPGYAATLLGVGDSLVVTIGAKPYHARITHKSQVSTDKSPDTAVAALLVTLPRPLISGQGAETTLSLGTSDHPLTLPPGPWVSSGRLEWVYRVSADGTTATKTKVQLSTDYDRVIVVLDGLEEHDRIITDAYEEFGGAETIAIEGADHAGTQSHP